MDSDCSSGMPTYYAWYEFYPEDSDHAVRPALGAAVRRPARCRISAPVTSSPPAWSRIRTAPSRRPLARPPRRERRLGASPPRTARNVRPARRSFLSAEWIAEAPCCTSSGGTLPLADFGTVTFTNATATVNGVSGSIGAFYTDTPATWWQCAMVTQSTSLPVSYPPASNELMALPSALTGNNGSGFTDNWYSVGP